MSKVLVTGAGGFTGYHLIAALIEKGHDVHGLSRNPGNRTFSKKISVYSADLNDKDSIFSVISHVNPEKVVHLGAISFVGHDNVEEIYRTNMMGTRNLLEALSRNYSPPSSVLIASSANIYGNQREGVIDENAHPEPVNDYSVSKLAMEYIAKLYMNRLPIVITRPFNYTGVGQSKKFLIPKIVDYVRRREPRIELGNIDIERDWSDVRVVVNNYVRLLDTYNALGKTINICSGKATSLRSLVDTACMIAGHSMKIETNPNFVRENEVRSLTGSNKRLKELIDIPIEYSINDTLRWMIEQ